MPNAQSETPPAQQGVEESPADISPATTIEHVQSGRASHEAAWLAFTEIYVGPAKWNLTLREGATPAVVDQLFETLRYATERIRAEYNAERGASDMPVSETPSRTPPARRAAAADDRPPQPDETPRRAAGAAGDGAAGQPTHGMWRIVRLEVAGTLEQPTVKMFSDNPALKFPVATPTSKIVIDLVERRYGAGALSEKNVDMLQQPGRTIPLKQDNYWQVYWQQSPKNDKWKDTVEIVIPQLETQEAGAR